MKQMKKLSAMATASMAIGLLLGTSMALAEEVCLDGDTVIGIKDLVVVTNQFDTINIDVDFRYATGFDVYGSGLDNFPFDMANAEEDLFATMAAINNTLGANNPVPGSAGQPGEDVYFIGAEEESEGGAGLIAAVGSENLTGDFWDPCTQANDCLVGAAVLDADERFTYADLSRASGSSCSNAPPDPEDPPTTSYPIAPCITGSWFLPARDGEGYVIEIIGPSLEPEMLAYFYTYDDAGNQMWLIGQGAVNGDTAVLPMQVTSGPVYGDDYDPTDVLREDWGTLTFKFTSKDAGSVVRDSTMGFGTTTVDIIRLTSVTGLMCP
jgi:hypothetical protein